MLPHEMFIRQLSQLDRTSPQFSDRLTTLLGEEKSWEHIFDLPARDALWLVDHLDNILDTLTSASSAFKGCLCALGWICKTRGILPQSYMLPGIPLITSAYPTPSGTVADIHEGFFDGSEVYVKQLRNCSAHSDGEVWRAHVGFQEAVVWKHAKHPNIVPFLGITSAPLQLVSIRMSGGDLMEYAKKYPRADRLALLLGVAEALNYLHSRHVVHGDLKGPSIKVDDGGRACITDFGLSTVTPDLEPAVPIHECCSVRWTAPEILRGEAGISKETDVYSFGMVVIEVSSGSVPFADSSPTSVVMKVMMGKRPPRPKDPIVTDGLWSLTQRCLEENPRLRPEIAEVTSYLRNALAGRQDYADTPDVVAVDDTALGRTRERKLYPICLSAHGYRLWRRYKLKRPPSENESTSDCACSMEFRGRWESDTRESIKKIRFPKRKLLTIFFPSRGSDSLGRMDDRTANAKFIEKIRFAKRKLVIILRRSWGSINLSRVEGGTANIQPIPFEPSDATSCHT